MLLAIAKHTSMVLTFGRKWQTCTIPKSVIPQIPGVAQLVTSPRNTDPHKTGKSSVSPVPEEYKDMKFTTFYRFPNILLMRFITRMKLYQSAITVVMLPTSAYLHTLNLVPVTTVQASLGVTAFACVMLYIMSHYSQRLIGLMSLSDCNSIVCFSHLTFWGGRNDVYVPVKEVIPLSDLPERPADAYICLRRYDTSDILYFTLRWGSILNVQKFTTVFGTMT